MAFSNTKTALAHSISYEMTLRFGLPHGIACSFTLPMVLERARRRGRRARRRARAASSTATSRGAPRAAARRSSQRVGVKTDFAAYGVHRGRLAPHGGAGAGRRARQELHRQPGDERMSASSPGSTASRRVIDRISIWAGKAVAWLIVPMFLVLFYEVMVRKFLQPDDLGQRHRHHVLRRALLPRRRLHAAPAEAHPHRLLLARTGRSRPRCAWTSRSTCSSSCRAW